MKDKDDKFELELTLAFQDFLEEYLNPLHKLSDKKAFSASTDVKFNEENERKSIKIFLSTRCSCTRDCQKQTSEDELWNSRTSFRNLTRNEQNCYILGQLKSCTKFTDIAKSGRNKTKRKRKKYNYQISADRPVCRDVFLYYHGESSKRLKRIQKHLSEYGVTPLIHGNTGRKPTHACTKKERETIKLFIVNYAAAHGLPDPGRNARKGKSHLRILLPSVMNHRSVHQIYEESMGSHQTKSLGYKTFLRIWQDEVPYIEFNNPRTDLCMTCEEFKKKINQISVQLDDEREAKKIEIYQKALDHIIDAKTERAYYRASANVAQKHYKRFMNGKISSPIQANSYDMVMHYSWDFAQQLHYPFEEQQVGPIYFKTPRRAQVFGVCNEAIPRQINYLIDEADFLKKDANTVISLLDHFFTHHALGEKHVHLTADNYVGQNKNNALLQYLQYRILKGLHTNIEMSFLIVGHTKFSPDGYFGLIRRCYRRSQIYTYEQLASVIENSSVTGHNQCQRYSKNSKSEAAIIYKDWSGWLSQFFKKLPKITQYQHFNFRIKTPGIVYVKSRVNSAETPHQILLKKYQSNWEVLEKSTPKEIYPEGLTAERETYLYEKIRCHIPDKKDKDLTCPKPSKK